MWHPQQSMYYARSSAFLYGNIHLAGEMTKMPLISLHQSGLPIETDYVQPVQVASCILVPVGIGIPIMTTWAIEEEYSCSIDRSMDNND